MALWFSPGSPDQATRAAGAPHEPGAITGGDQRLDELAGSCSPGPFFKDVVAVMKNSKLLSRVPKVEDRAVTSLGADGYGYNAILICCDINSEKFGIWALNVTGDREVKDMQDHGTQAAYGWYMHVYGEIPNAQQWYELSGKGLGWSADALKQLKDYQPDVYRQVRLLQGFPDPDQNKVDSGGDPYRPAGGGISEVKPNRPGKELSMFSGPNGPIWYAGTEKESMTAEEHPGISYAGPKTWKGEWGMPEENGLPEGCYLLTADDPTDPATVRPSKREWRRVMERASMGDDGAREVIEYFGQEAPGNNNLWSRLFG